MKIGDFISLSAGVTYYIWVILTLLGGMVAGLSVILFPYGALPILIFIGILAYYKFDDLYQDLIAKRFRSGITEYPLEISMHLYGNENENKISFSLDGRSIKLGMMRPEYSYIDDIETPDGIKNYLKSKSSSSEHADTKWIDKYIVSDIHINEDSGELSATITIPDETALSRKYIEHEIKNIGRVFKTNSAGNSIRWLQHAQGERKTLIGGSGLFVYIDRRQVIPGFFGSKVVTMSERQITRNIKNRLWNRADVECVSLTDTTYCGKILNAKW